MFKRYICIAAIIFFSSALTACIKESTAIALPAEQFEFEKVIEKESEIYDINTEIEEIQEDIIFYLMSLYEARRVITDKDMWFGLFFEILSGQEYIVEQNQVVLEALKTSKTEKSGEWERVNHKHVNVGLKSNRNINRCEMFLREPLEAGRYRVRLIIHKFTKPMASYAGQLGGVELTYEFDVITHADAPQPKWEISRLIPSEINAAEQSAGIRMSIANPVLDKDNIKFEIILEADNFYSYGSPYSIEVSLDEKWYRVPFTSIGFTGEGYSIGWDNRNRSAAHSINPVFAVGILPAGQYRIIKEFDLRERTANEWEWGDVIAKEFATGEFTVKETLENID
jgi:hypothetical protein